VPDLLLLVIDHPLGGEPLDTVAERAAQAARALEAAAHVRPPKPVQPA
jgi:hypothetical protein